MLNEYDEFMKNVEYSENCLIPEDSKKLYEYHDLMKQKLKYVLEKDVPAFTKEELWEYIDFFEELKGTFDNCTYIPCLDEIIKRDKNDERALLLKSIDIGDRGKFAQAVTLLKKAIKINPENHKALFLKSQFLLFQGEKLKKRENYIEGLKNINRALELEEGIQKYWLKKKSFLRDFIEAEEPDAVVEGINDYLLNCYKDFYSDLDEMIEDKAACYQKAIDLHMINNSAENDFSIEANNKLDATDVSLYCYLLIDLGRYEKALKYLKLEEELEDYDIEETVHHNNLLRVECYENIGKYKEAIKYRILYNQKLKEDDDFLYNEYDGEQGRLLRKLGKEKKAMDILVPLAIQAQAEKGNIADNYGLLEDLGLYDEAIKAFEQSSKSLSKENIIQKSHLREYEKDLSDLKEKRLEDPIPVSWKKLLKKNFDLENLKVKKSVIRKYQADMQ